MGCPHCMSACTKQGEDFDKDNIMEFVNFFKVMGFKALTISGGEPTEHPDFLDIVNTLVWEMCASGNYNCFQWLFPGRRTQN